MSNSSEEGRPAQQIPPLSLADRIRQTAGACQTFPVWCENGSEPHTEHRGVPDLPPVSATGEPNDLRTGQSSAGHSGVLAPKVSVALWQDTSYQPTEPGALADELQVSLTIQRPDGGEAEAHMTLHEADFLRRHLVQAISDAVES